MEIPFQVHGDWLTNFLRERYWNDQMSYEEALEKVCQFLHTTEEGYKVLREKIGPGILQGKLKLEGVNNFDIVDDDQEEAYHKSKVYKKILRQEERKQANAVREAAEASVIKEVETDFRKRREDAKVVKITMWDRQWEWDPKTATVYWAVPDEDYQSEYGLISPTGDYYSCNFAGHNALACHLVERDTRLLEGCRNKYPTKYGSVYDTALQYLFELGWLAIRNPYPSGRAYPDWHPSNYFNEDDLPQGMLNTLYEWKEKWNA